MKYYFVTGTSRGIGKALAQELLVDQDCKVFGLSRSVSIYDDRYVHLYVDLADTKVVADFKFPDIKDSDEIVLVNNAGILAQVAYSGNLQDEKIISGFNVNIITPSILINKFISHYKHHRGKKIILNISSGAAQRPVDGWSIYCSTKAAIDMLSRTVQEEANIQKNGFKIFAVAPGVVDTAMQEQIRGVSKSDFSTVDRFKSLKEEGELLHPEVVARKIVYFLEKSDQFNEVIISLKTAI